MLVIGFISTLFVLGQAAVGVWSTWGACQGYTVYPPEIVCEMDENGNVRHPCAGDRCGLGVRERTCQRKEICQESENTGSCSQDIDFAEALDCGGASLENCNGVQCKGCMNPGDPFYWPEATVDGTCALEVDANLDGLQQRGFHARWGNWSHWDECLNCKTTKARSRKCYSKHYGETPGKCTGNASESMDCECKGIVTTRGCLCKAGFLYRRRFYRRCTKAGHNQLWCYVDKKSCDIKETWDNCRSKKPAPGAPAPPAVEGCMDSEAPNFNPEATIKGTCDPYWSKGGEVQCKPPYSNDMGATGECGLHCFTAELVRHKDCHHETATNKCPRIGKDWGGEVAVPGSCSYCIKCVHNCPSKTSAEFTPAQCAASCADQKLPVPKYPCPTCGTSPISRTNVFLEANIPNEGSETRVTNLQIGLGIILLGAVISLGALCYYSKSHGGNSVANPELKYKLMSQSPAKMT